MEVSSKPLDLRGQICTRFGSGRPREGNGSFGFGWLPVENRQFFK